MTEEPIRADDVEMESVEWLWEDRIPKKMISVIAGRPDQGKGLMGVRITSDVTLQGINVLYSAHEDTAGIMTKPRLVAAGADLTRVRFKRFILWEDWDRVIDWIEKYDIGLIVMDPLAAHLGKGVTRYSDSIRPLLSAMTELAEKTGVSFLLIEHVLKNVNPKAHVLSAIGGSSSGLVAAARGAYVLGIHPDDPDKRVFAKAKLNVAESPPPMVFQVEVEDIANVGPIPYLTYEEDLDDTFNPMTLFKNADGQGATVGRPADKRAEAAEWLSTYLLKAGGPVKAGDVIEDAKQNGMSIRTLRRAAKDMRIVRNPPGGGPSCTWDLPQHVKDQADPPPTTPDVSLTDEDLHRFIEGEQPDGD